MNNLVKFTAVLALALSTTACATVTRGTNDVFVVETTPSGAQVMTTAQRKEKDGGGYYSCDATPCSFKMPRKSEFEVTVSKVGYKTTTHSITNKVSKAGGMGMAGNVLVGGIIGAAVDGTTGAMKDLTPNPLIVVMESDDGIIATEPEVMSEETMVGAAES